MNKAEFLHSENWHGGPTYQLAMAWPAGDDHQILNAIRALWQAPGITGPWKTPSQFPELSPIQTTLDRETGLMNYGLLALTDGTEVGCILYAIMQEQPVPHQGLDWLFIAIYHGMQQRAFDFVYSDRLRHDNPWLAKIDEHYLEIAERVYTAIPFAFATIDFEGLPPFDGSRDILTEIQASGGGCLLPNNETWVGRTVGWIERSSGLCWLSPRQE